MATVSRSRTRGIVSTPGVGATSDPEASDRTLRIWEGQLARESKTVENKISSAVGNSPTAGQSGKEITVQLTAGSVTVHHGLGRAPKGWQQVRLVAAAAVSYAESGANDSTITFVASGAARLTVWVY